MFKEFSGQNETEVQKEFRIQEVSLRLDLPRSTIRYWEHEFSDLVRPRRTHGGQRRYSKGDILNLNKIKRLLHHKNKSIDEARNILFKGNADKGKIDWENQTVLVTGGTGSFGRHFCRILIGKYRPKVLRIYSRDAMKQQEIRKHKNKGIRYFIGDVRDYNRLRRAMEGVDIVVHAACLSQVRSCEYNPLEAVKTNILGASNIIDASIDTGVKKVMALSTDKAVYPVTIYGATALCVEKIFIQGNVYSGPRATRFSCVRCGNAIGSLETAMSLFNESKKGDNITIANQGMTRFWITNEQVSDMVVKGLETMEGGEIFVPRIPSVRIIDLLKALFPECSLSIEDSLSAQKVHEELISKEDSARTIIKNGCYVILQDQVPWADRDSIKGERLPAGFSYRSDKNDQWLSVEEIRGALKKDSDPKIHTGQVNLIPLFHPSHPHEMENAR